VAGAAGFGGGGGSSSCANSDAVEYSEALQKKAAATRDDVRIISISLISLALSVMDYIVVPTARGQVLAPSLMAAAW
jgi:hypothetical protein